MLKEEYCKVLCQVDLKTKDVNEFKQAIQRQYHHNWIIDNLPAASILDTDQYVSTQYIGYPVGKWQLKCCFFLNVYVLVIDYLIY